MSGAVLVTGATGTVGGELLEHLVARQATVRAAVRDTGAARLPDGAQAVAFDFSDASTYAAALDGVDRVFLLRPPHMADAAAFEPFIAAVAASSVEQLVFLSLQGVERNPVVPHHGIEKRIRESGVGWTFLRPGFYMQNLLTTHLADIRERHEVFVPAGGGRTSLIDARDIAEAAAVVLTAPGHVECAYTLTGPQAITYSQVAAILSEVCGYPITYVSPSGRAFSQRMRERGYAPEFVTVMRGIYLVARLRMAAGLTDELEHLIGRAARDFRTFARDHAEQFRG